MGAARRPDLYEGKLVLINRVLLEESLQNSLGVIHAIDAYAEKRCVHAQLSEQVDAFGVGRFSGARTAGDSLKVHADWKRFYYGAMVLAVDRKMLPIDS